MKGWSIITAANKIFNPAMMNLSLGMKIELDEAICGRPSFRSGAI